MDGLNQFVADIVERTIEALHERGLLILNESDEEKAARMFDGKLELSLNDLQRHPACGWSRKKVIKLLKEGKIKDSGTSQRDYRISAMSVYRLLTEGQPPQVGVDINKPRDRHARPRKTIL